MREAKQGRDAPADTVDVRALAPEQRHLIVELVAQMARAHPNWMQKERRSVVRLRLA